MSCDMWLPSTQPQDSTFPALPKAPSGPLAVGPGLPWPLASTLVSATVVSLCREFQILESSIANVLLHRSCFHFALFIWASSTWWLASVIHSACCWMNIQTMNIHYCTDGLCTFDQRHIWIVSSSCLLWVKLLWAVKYRPLCGHVFSLLWVNTLAVGLLDHVVSIHFSL